MMIKDLKTGSSFTEISGEIVSIGETRAFASQRGSGKVASAALRDDEGEEVRLSLWNEQIDQVKEGDKITIENGWCSEWQGQKQVSTGKQGTLKIIK